MIGAKTFKTFLHKAIQSYQEFANQSVPLNAKEFNAYHTACKSALMHIALLDKLTAEQTTAPPLPLEMWLNQAKEELKDENDLS